MACTGGQQCEGRPGFPFWDALACFTCIPGEPSQQSQFADNNCGSGCSPCYDFPDDLRFSRNYHNGKRFLGATDRTRDARGRRHDLGPGHKAVPLSNEYRWAPYFKQRESGECYNNLCDGMPSTRTTPEPGETYCVEGDAPCGTEVRGQFKDCHIFIGTGWGMDRAAGNMICRHLESEKDPTLLQLFSPRLQGPILARTTGCAANALILCSAKIAGSICESSYLAEVNRHALGFQYYADALGPFGCKQIWDYAHITGLTASFKPPAKEQDPDGSLAKENALKNAAIDTLKRDGFINENGSVQRFDRLDTMIPQFGNSAIGWWRRTFDGKNLPATNSPVVATLKAFPSQDPAAEFDVELRAYAASVEVYVVPYRRDEKVPSDLITTMHPYTRAKIKLWLSVTVAPDKTIERVQPWRSENDPLRTKTLRIINNLEGFGMPGIEGGVDRLVYSYGGVNIRVPWSVEWLGWLGAFSDPSFEDVYVNDFTCRGSFCPQVASGLSPLVVPGWSTHYDSKPDGTAKETYAGSVTFSWTENEYHACCD